MKRSVVLLLTVIILASCGEKKEDKSAQLAKLKKERAQIDDKIRALETEVNKDQPEAETPVRVMTLESKKFQSYIEVQASVSGDENILATPQAPGIVSRVHVRPGQYVRKGQVLATLDAAVVEQNIKSIQANLTLAKQLYEKQQKLWDQKIGSEVQLLQTKAAYESVQKQYEAQIAQRNMSRIIAPISGTVDAVNVNVGDMASPGQIKGIRVVSYDKLKVVSQLGENYIGKVEKGDPVQLLFTEVGDTINAKLSYVARSVDPVSRAFNVEVWLGNKKNISPNMSCKMRIANYEKDNALSIPISAIQKTAEGDMVYTVKNGKAEPTYIETGRNSDGMIEVTSGLSAGDQVITEGQTEVTKGEKVAIEK